MMIELDGLDPRGVHFGKVMGVDLDKEINYGKSTYSAPGYVYFFEDEKAAQEFGCGMVAKVGMGPFAQVFEIDSNVIKVERDPLFHKGSWRHTGKIEPKDLISFEVFDCKKKIQTEPSRTCRSKIG